MENSKTYQYRKVMKPMLERKRRARINKCLDDLKDLMVECLTEEGEHIVRLEKADILELTVDYLKKQKHKKQYLETTTVESFRTGYIHAANEVSKALASIPDVNINLGTTLMTHLGHRLNQIQPLIVSTLQCQQQQSSNQQSTNLMSPLKIELENEVNSSISSISSVLSQMSPTSSGYHSDPPSPASSESSFFEKNSIIKNNYEESSKDVWRPW